MGAAPDAGRRRAVRQCKAPHAQQAGPRRLLLRRASRTRTAASPQSALRRGKAACGGRVGEGKGGRVASAITAQRIWSESCTLFPWIITSPLHFQCEQAGVLWKWSAFALSVCVERSRTGGSRTGRWTQPERRRRRLRKRASFRESRARRIREPPERAATGPSAEACRCGQEWRSTGSHEGGKLACRVLHICSGSIAARKLMEIVCSKTSAMTSRVDDRMKRRHVRLSKLIELSRRSFFVKKKMTREQERVATTSARQTGSRA